MKTLPLHTAFKKSFIYHVQFWIQKSFLMGHSIPTFHFSVWAGEFWSSLSNCSVCLKIKSRLITDRASPPLDSGTGHKLTHKWAQSSSGPSRGPVERMRQSLLIKTTHNSYPGNYHQKLPAQIHCFQTQIPKAPMSNFFAHRFICTSKNADISFPIGLMLKFSPAHILFSYFHNLISLFSHLCNFSHDFLSFIYVCGCVTSFWCVKNSYLKKYRQIKLKKVFYLY